MKIKTRISICLAVLAMAAGFNVCAAANLTVTANEPNYSFLYMNDLEKSFYKPNAYNLMFQASKQNHKLVIADSKTKYVHLVLKPYEDTGVAYDITELPVREANCGLFAVSATAGAHAQNLGYWLIGVLDGEVKLLLDYDKLAKKGFKPDEWNRLHGKYEDYAQAFVITATTEYMPPWGSISADLIAVETGKWACIWNPGKKSFSLEKLELEKPCIITDDFKAMVYMDKFIRNSPRFKQLLEGTNVQLSYAAKNPDGADGLEVHEIKVIEDHPTHIVTRATFRINEIADIYYYDVVNNKYEKVR